VPTITYKIIHEPTPPAQGVAPEVEHVLQRAMVKMPEGRFQSAGEFRTALIQAAALQRSGGTPGHPTHYAPAPAVSGGFGAAMTVAGPPPFAAVGSSPGVTGMQSAAAAPSYQPYVPPTTARRSIGATLGLIALFAGLLGGAGWAVSTAFNNQQIQAGYSRGEQAYASAVKLYDQKKYAEAAAEFGKVRGASGVRAETVAKATQGEVYSYRVLGQQAQAGSDLATAESWFQKAVDLAPTDAQALEELAAVRKLRGLAGPAGPSDQARLNGAVNTRGTDLQHAIPPVQSPLAGLIERPGNAAGPGGLAAPTTPEMPGQRTTSDFTGDNARKAQEASRLYAAGEEALKRGDRDGALRLYHAAVAAGPGSPAAIQAQSRISRYSYSDPLSGI
ncbi:MAG TPA: hypothetical protein VM490_15365, partial [Armatimonadaceae bacterium]|nr:hypothetical protein [Armatimonadaceae bacterium]